MKEDILYPKYRYVMGTILVLASSLTVLVYMATTPVLTRFVEEFGVSMATAGYATTIHVIFMGIFVFIGPVIIGYIDIKNTQIIGLAIAAAGFVVAWKAASFPMLLVARAITGLGHGLSSACTNSVFAAWFPTKERSVIITINNIAIAVISAIGYSIVVPLSYTFGSWRGVMLMVAIITGILSLLWIILGRDNHALNEYIARKNAEEGKKTSPFSGMREALTRKDIWMLSMYMGLATIASNGLSTYLPQFLQNVRGYTDVSASTTVGLTNAVGIVATLLGGVVTTGFGLRKMTIVPFMFMTAIFGGLSIIFKTPLFIACGLVLYTFALNFRTTASWTIVTEVEGSTPALVSGSSALIYTIGFIGTMAVAPMYSLGEGMAQGTGGMLIFVPVFVLSAVFACLCPETGPRKGLPLRFQMAEKKKG